MQPSGLLCTPKHITYLWHASLLRHPSGLRAAGASQDNRRRVVHRIAVTKDSTVILAQTAVPAVKAGLSAKMGQKVPATALHRHHVSAIRPHTAGRLRVHAGARQSSMQPSLLHAGTSPSAGS